MGKEKWAEVFEYLRSSNRDPKKTLKLLKGSDKGIETSYTVSRSSYSMNVIATITQKKLDPKNKGKTLTHIIRTWVKSKDFQDFYNLIRSNEKLVWKKEKIEEYVKQINDLWSKPNQKHFRNYFEATKGYLIMGTGSKVGTKRKVKNSLYGADEKTIKSAVKKLKKNYKNKN